MNTPADPSVMHCVTFRVHGVPAQQGSKRHVGGGQMVEQSAATLVPWRSAIAAEAAELAATYGTLDGPLALTVEFRFRMPKSRPATVRAEGVAPKTTAPDLDKLVRAVGDSLQSSGLIRDDARICLVTASKVEVLDGWTGAEITVEQTFTEPVVAAVRGVDQ